MLAIVVIGFVALFGILLANSPKTALWFVGLCISGPLLPIYLIVSLDVWLRGKAGPPAPAVVEQTVIHHQPTYVLVAPAVPATPAPPYVVRPRPALPMTVEQRP